MRLISKQKGKKTSKSPSIEITFSSCVRDKPQKPVKDNFTQCYCCGTLLKHPATVEKFKCSICQCTVATVQGGSENSHQPRNSASLKQLLKVVENCCTNLKHVSRPITSFKRHEIFSPVEEYLATVFSDTSNLNESFVGKDHNNIIDYDSVSKFYKVILELPTKRPFYKLTVLCNELLKKPRMRVGRDTHPTSAILKLRWIFIILQIPILKDGLITRDNASRLEFVSPQLRAILYEIIKRCIGYLSSVNSETGKQYVHYLKRLDKLHFCEHVDLINLYITFHFTRILQSRLALKRDLNSPGFDEFHDSEKLNPSIREVPAESIPRAVNSFLRPSHDSKHVLPASFKFKIADYGNNWHIRTASRLALFYFAANQSKKKCSISRFYNTMVDFIDYKKDFDQWKTMQRVTLSEREISKRNNFDDTSLILGDFYSKKQSMSQFTMCQFFYLLSLGMKISIMDYETRRIMEYNAEQAFLKALDKKLAVDVYLRIKVRRDHISQDSLRCIKGHQMDLKKSLKVEFVDEPGIDAGGLRKEWFLLLTRELFNPKNGLFIYVAESRLSWFNSMADVVQGARNDTLELFYLFGVVLGLAIYNGTILDLSFPSAMYKKLCHEPLSKDDFMELYPDTGRNLVKMLDYKGEDFEDVFGLTFEVNYLNPLTSKVNRKELCPGGANRSVTLDNRHEYVKLWMDFYMNKSIKASFESFFRGFRRVIESDSFKLFSSEELEQLLCGSQEKDIDVELLRTVTKYGPGWSPGHHIIEWFWKLFISFSYGQKKKLLQFVTGSDRVPATGVATIPFKITRLGADSEKLPLAHTCFNELCLYEYSSKERLENKLTLAINESEGYGFR